MKKAAKIFAIIGVCTLFFGIFICIAGYAMGARFHSLDLWDDAILHYSMYGYGGHSDNDIYIEEGVWDGEGYYKEITSDFDKLELDMNWGNCSITAVDGLDHCEIIGYQVDEEDLKVEVSGKTLKVSYDYSGGSAWSGNNTHWKSDTDIQINIPNKEYTEAKLESGIGSIMAQSLRVGKLEVNVDAGSFDGFELTVSDSSILKAEAGSLIITSLNGGTLKAECEAGNIEVYEAVLDGGELKCEVGNITLSLEQPEEDYNYIVDCEMGNVDVGSVSYGGFNRQRKIDNGASATLKLDCEMGNIEVFFQ